MRTRWHQIIGSFVLASTVGASQGCRPTNGNPGLISKIKTPKKELPPEDCQRLFSVFVKNPPVTHDPLFMWNLSQALYFASLTSGHVKFTVEEARRVLESLPKDSSWDSFSTRLQNYSRNQQPITLFCGEPLEKVSPWSPPDPVIRARIYEPADRAKSVGMIRSFGIPDDEAAAFLRGNLLSQYVPNQSKKIVLITVSPSQRDPRIGPTDSPDLGYLQDKFLYYMTRAQSPYVRRYFLVRAMEALDKRFALIIRGLENHGAPYTFLTIPSVRKLDLLTLIDGLRFNQFAYIVVERD